MQTELPSELQREIDRVCDDFESALRSGSQPRVEDYTKRVGAVARTQLRAELSRLVAELGYPKGNLDIADRDAARPGSPPANVQSAASKRRSPADISPAEPPDPAPKPAPAAQEDDPRILGDYRLIREIGRGGQGVVYEAQQVSLDKHVAVKALPFARVLNPNALQRFKNEARAAAQLRHPNILPVHAFGSERGVHYYVMDYIEGGTLEDLIDEIGQQSRQLADTQTYRDSERADEAGGDPAATTRDMGPLRTFIETVSSRGSLVPRDYFRRITNIGIGVAEALHYAHENGIIHRDIKPSNLLLDTEGKVWVADFGLAQLEGNPDLTKPGEFMGTLRYMSPEQGYANRVTLDGRTDVFSLGATLYELLTLRPAFDGESKAEILRQVAFDEPRPPRKVDARIPKDLETIVLKALEKKPENRYKDAQELARDLRAWMQRKRIAARRPTVVQRTAKWAGKNKALVASMAAVVLTSVLAAIAGLAVALETERQQNERLARLLRQSEGLRLVAHASLERPRNPGLAVALATEGAGLYPSLEANNALLEAIDANHEHRVLRGHQSPVGMARHSPDGNRIVTTASRHWYHFGPEPASIWDAESGKRLAFLVEDWTITSAAFSPQGRRILTAASPTTWHQATDDELASRPPAVWDTQRAVKIGPLQGAFLLEALPTAFRTVDQKTEIVTPAKGNTARIYNAAGDEERKLEGHQRRVTYAGFSPDGSRVVTISDDNTVRIWNADSAVPIRTFDWWRLQKPDEKFALVGRAVFSPDGRSLLTASSTLGVHLWDLETGESRPLGDGEFASFSPDGELIAISRREKVRVLDVQTTGLLCELPGHARRIRHLEFSDDSRLVVTATRENLFRAWESATGELLAEFRGHALSVPYASFSPDSRRLVSASDDRTARIWNLASGAQQAHFPAKIDQRQPLVSFDPEGRRLCVVAAPEGRTTVWDLQNAAAPVYSIAGRPRLPNSAEQRFVTRSDDRVSVRDFQSGAEIASLKTHGLVRDARISLDGQRVLALVENGPVWLWDVDGGRRLQLTGHKDAVYAGAFQPDGKRAATGGQDKTARIWNTTTGQQIKSLPHDQPVVDVKFSLDGTKLLTVTDGNRAHVWNTTTLERLWTLQSREGRFNRAVFSVDGKYVLTHRWAEGESIICWDTASGQSVGTLADVAGRVNVHISATAPEALVASDRAGLFWWNFASGQSRRLSDTPTAFAVFTADGRRIVSATAQPASSHDLGHRPDAGFAKPLLQFWDTGEWKLQGETPSRHGAVRWMGIAPRSGLLIVDGSSYSTRVFDAQTRRQLAVFHGHAAPICFARFAPDGQRVITCSWDQTVVLWDLPNQRPLRVLAQHQAPIKAAMISTDGKLLAAGDEDGAVNVWDLEKQTLVHRLGGLSAPIAHCSFSAFAGRLLAFTLEGDLRIWDASGQVVETSGVTTKNVVWAEYAAKGSALLIVSKTASRRREVTVVPAEGETAISVPHQGIVTNARLGPRGRYLLTVTRDSVQGQTVDVAFVRDVGSDKQPHRITKPGARIHHAVLNSRGTMLMTHHGTNVSVWDTGSQNPILNVANDLDFFVSDKAESFSPDGATLILISPDGRVRTVPMDPLALVTEKATRSLSHDERVRFRVREGN